MVHLRQALIMKLEVTHCEPFEASALGVFNVTGKFMHEREAKLWDMVQTIVGTEQLRSMEYRRHILNSSRIV